MHQYNYRLEIGTIGTNDESLAGVFYNINRLETTENPSKLWVIISESEDFWKDYAEKNKIPADTLTFIEKKIKEAYDLAKKDPKEARKKMQRIIPVLLELDDQSTAANKISAALGPEVNEDEEKNRTIDFQFYIGDKGLMRKNTNGSNKVCLYACSVGIHWNGDYLEKHSIEKIDGEWVYFKVFVQSRERDEDDPYADPWWETHSFSYKIKFDGTELIKV